MDAAGWRDVNGWEALRRFYGGRLPNFRPYTLSVELDVPSSADAFTPTPLVTGTVVNESDAEFWVLATMHAGFFVDAPAIEQLGDSPANDGDLWYGAIVDVREEEGGRSLSNVPVYPSSIFGAFGRQSNVSTNQRRSYLPYYLPAPWILPPGATVRCQVQATWAGQNSAQPNGHQRVWFSFLGFKRFMDTPPPPVDFFVEPRLAGVLDAYRRNGLRPRVEPYFYGLNLAPTFGQTDAQMNRAAMNTESVSVSISDADFAAIYLSGVIHDPNNVWRGQEQFLQLDAVNATNGEEDTVRLNVDQGRVRLDERPVAWSNYIGTGKEPVRLAYPLILKTGQGLTAIVQFGETNLVDNNPFRAYITVGGVRIWT